jgi:predicted RNA-binding Zn-ribbon protein involved in translation (DUF1610 family)
MQIPEQPLQITARDILFECPGCGKSMVIDQAAIGWMVECVGCGTNVIVPGRLAPDAGRWTPLMVAAYAGDSRAVKALLDSGADVHQSSAGRPLQGRASAVESRRETLVLRQTQFQW